MTKDNYLSTLKKNGLRDTQERRKIFNILLSQKSPCSIAELVQAAKSFADRSTVYRTLEIFEKIDITTRVYTGWKYKIELSDTFSHHHHHMLCLKCGRILSFEESPRFLEELKKIESQHGFIAQSHTLELQGLCDTCC